MRVIPEGIPRFEQLNLPAQLQEIVELRNGIVLVTGPTGSGKSSTLAAILDKMNAEKAYPHPHDRRSHRISAPPQESHDSSARIAQRHADVRARAARGACAKRRK